MQPTSQRSLVRALLACGNALAVSVIALGSAAAQSGSLCDALPPDELHALGEPRYAQLVAIEDFCFYDAAPDQAGPHSVTLSLTEVPPGATFTDVTAALRQANPDIVDVDVAGQPGYIDPSFPDATSVVVGIDGRMLSVLAAVAESAERSALDPTAYALAIAELVVPALETSGPEPAPVPPDVEGVEWRVGRSSSGSDLEAEVDEVMGELWQLLLAASGTSFGEAAMVEAVARDPGSNERVGSYVALRIGGADAAALVPAVVEWMAGLPGAEGLEASAATFAGKEVTQIARDGVPQGFIHASGDTIHLLTMPQELAVAVVERLP